MRIPDHMVWPAGLIVAFTVLVVWNAYFVYMAVSDADPVVPSYHTEHR